MAYQSWRLNIAKSLKCLMWLVVAGLTTSTHFISSRLAPPILNESNLQEADLLFRSGDDAVSAAIKVASTGTWSHVGLLTRNEESWVVIHALPAGSEGKAGGVMVEPVAEFLAHAEAVGVFRSVHSEKGVAITKRARLVLGRPFGLAPSETYCTKLIMDAFTESATPLPAESHLFSIFGQSFQLVLPQALAESTQLHRIY